MFILRWQWCYILALNGLQLEELSPLFSPLEAVYLDGQRLEQREIDLVGFIDEILWESCKHRSHRVLCHYTSKKERLISAVSFLCVADPKKRRRYELQNEEEGSTE